MQEYRPQLEEEINFLVWWGKLDRRSAIKLPRTKRKMWIDFTLKNINSLFGDGSTSND